MDNRFFYINFSRAKEIRSDMRKLTIPRLVGLFVFFFIRLRGRIAREGTASGVYGNCSRRLLQSGFRSCVVDDIR